MSTSVVGTDEVAASPAWNGADERLMARLSGFGAAGFVVLDGAGYDTTGRLLRSRHLRATSLFLGQGGVEMQDAGPWLVALGQRSDTLEQVWALSGKRPPLVAWVCDAGEPALLRHLRTINSARVPGWAAAGLLGPDAAAAALPAQTALFRHWDPSVLDTLLPVLDAAQFACILGPAQEIAFVTPDTLRLRQVPRDPDWPPAPRGFLTLSTEQMLALADRRVAVSNRRLAAYLRDVAPDHVAHLSEAELWNLAAQHQREALGFGIRADRETFMWSFMRVTSVGDLSRDEGIVRLMADQRLGMTPEARLRRFYDMRLDYLRQME